MLINLRKWIVLIIRNLFYYLGFTIEKIPDANQFFAQSKFISQEIQKHEFKRLASKNRLANRHKEYNELLKVFVPDWVNNLTSSEFIGSGSGADNLCVYRKVCFDNNYYFEKVYFNNSHDLLKVEWFYKSVYPILKNEINTTKLCKTIKGDLITIAYFEFIELNPLPKDVLPKALFSISKKMFSLSKYVDELSYNVPDFVKDYKLHFQYNGEVKAVEKIVRKRSNNRLTSKMIERVINLQPLVFTHGDLYHTNVFDGNYLVDWDSFGLFPHGFDCAFIFFSGLKSPVNLKSLQKTLIEEYKDVISIEQWDGFELSCLYFYLVFTEIDQREVCTKAMQKDVFQRIEKLYENVQKQLENIDSNLSQNSNLVEKQNS